jgi:tetratricopeptide (TPR) repeat protein
MERNTMFENLLTKSYGGLMYDSVKEYRELIRFLSKHLSQNPQNYHALINRAQAHAEIGNVSAARRDFDAAVRFAATDSIPYINRGRFRDFHADFRGAVEDFTRAIDISPLDMTVWRCRAYTYWRLGGLARAEQDFSHVVELDPDFEPTREGLAAVRDQLHSG